MNLFTSTTTRARSNNNGVVTASERKEPREFNDWHFGVATPSRSREWYLMRFYKRVCLLRWFYVRDRHGLFIEIDLGFDVHIDIDMPRYHNLTLRVALDIVPIIVSSFSLYGLIRLAMDLRRFQ